MDNRGHNVSAWDWTLRVLSALGLGLVAAAVMYVVAGLVFFGGSTGIVVAIALCLPIAGFLVGGYVGYELALERETRRRDEGHNRSF